MRKIILVTALLAAATPVTALATAYDGMWRVTVITDKGECDRAYGYDVAVSQGRVRYQGQASINLGGTVSPNGAVKVSVSKGGQRADGSGKLAANSGGGTWRGVGGTGACSGHWEAERR